MLTVIYVLRTKTFRGGKWLALSINQLDSDAFNLYSCGGYFREQTGRYLWLVLVNASGQTFQRSFDAWLATQKF